MVLRWDQVGRTAPRLLRVGVVLHVFLAPRGGTTASRDRHKLLTHQAFAKAISIHFLSRCYEASCVSREAFLACL